jgi:hypothetical protein
MSRGLGKMQRDILRTLDARVWRGPDVCTCPEDALTRLLCGHCPARFPYRDAAGSLYRVGEAHHVLRLRAEVAKLRGAWCETDCTRPRSAALRAMLRPGPHRPHIMYTRLVAGFDAAFARAITTLLRRGVLVHLHPAAPGARRHQRRQYVARPKC